MKSTPGRGVKEFLKPYAYKRSEHLYGVTACLLHNEPTSCRPWRGCGPRGPEPERKRVSNGVISHGRQTRNRVIYTCPG